MFSSMLFGEDFFTRYLKYANQAREAGRHNGGQAASLTRPTGSLPVESLERRRAAGWQPACRDRVAAYPPCAIVNSRSSSTLSALSSFMMQ